MSVAQKVRAASLTVSGYLVPLVQQIPPLGVYAGLMTLPVLLYLVALFSQLPMSFVDAVGAFLEGALGSPGALLINLVIVFGFGLVLYSGVFLHWHRKQGLVTTGPYRFIRHPQYTGFLLLTLGLTAWSYWLLSVTFGIGWLTPEGTIALWYAELSAYIILALIEDSYLLKQFGDGYAAYKRKVPSFLPLGRASRLDIPLSIAIFSLVLFGVIQLRFLAPGL